MVVTVLLDGLAYGMVLFVISAGLSVTMGMMGFVNLAHGAFAAVGAYATVYGVRALALPFEAALPLACLFTAAVGLVVERLLYRPLYRAGELEQALMTIGLIFVTTALVTIAFGPSSQSLPLPAWLDGRIAVGGIGLPTYRAAVILVGCVMGLALWLGLDRTLLGSRIRAAVDNPRMAEAVGIRVDRLFSLTFALGCALAALGGGLAVNVIGLSPRFPVQYLVYLLIVVAVGGLGNVGGAFLAAILLGTIENAGRYLAPQAGSFWIYLAAIALLLARPYGLRGRA
jgi:branched-chain amino acid transport system permease protein